MATRRGSAALLALCCALATSLTGAAPATAGTAPARPFDVDGNGVSDLVVGVPGEDLGDVQDPGEIAVFLAGSRGIGSTVGKAHQDIPGIVGAAEDGDRFGSVIASADFDRDGYADVAVGVPGESVGSAAGAGAVAVLHGSAGGLSTRDQLWTQDSAGIPGFSEAQDGWGTALAAGDLDGDGYGDLAVGAPGEDVGRAGDAGTVTVLYGGAGGLGTTRSTLWHQDVPGIAETADIADQDEEEDLHRGQDRFGAALAISDTTGDRRGELVVGAPGESVETGARPVIGGGAVHVLLGRSGGITAAGSSYWTQDTPGVLDQAEEQRDSDFDRAPGDGFGSALAAGDVDGDGRAEIAVGIPREDVGGVGDEGPDLQGAVAVLRGAPDGLTAAGNQFLHQDSPGVPGQARNDDRFGTSVALGDVTGDGRADLAAGAPGDSTGESPTFESLAWGSVVLLPATSSGAVGTAGAQYWSQVGTGVPGVAEDGDRFGSTLGLLDLGRGERRDLVVGVPGENAGAGLVHVLYSGGAGGITSSGSQTLDQTSPGVIGRPEPGDGFAVVAGR